MSMHTHTHCTGPYILSPLSAQGRRLVEGGGLYINHLRVSSVAEVFGDHHVLHGSLTVVRTGECMCWWLKWHSEA